MKSSYAALSVALACCVCAIGSKAAVAAGVFDPANATIEQLTVLATIFLPLTFVTGFFGQNFGWLVGHVNTVTEFVVYGVGTLLVSLFLLWAWLRRRRDPRPDRGAAI